MALVETRDLVKRFGRLTAVDHITYFHKLLALVEIAGRDTVTVIDDRKASFQIEIRTGQ